MSSAGFTLSPRHWALGLAVSLLVHAAVLSLGRSGSDSGAPSGGHGGRGSAEFRLSLALSGQDPGDGPGGVPREVAGAALDDDAPATPGGPVAPLESAAAQVLATASPREARAGIASLDAPAADPGVVHTELPASPALDSAKPDGHESSAGGFASLPSVSSGVPSGGSALSSGGHPGGAAAASAAASPGVGEGGAAASYWDHVVSRVEAAKRYPRRARRSGISGRALVAVRIDRAGRLVHCEIVRSSGSALLDRDAQATVERAAPFGEAPLSLVERDLEFEIPLSYDIARRH